MSTKKKRKLRVGNFLIVVGVCVALVTGCVLAGRAILRQFSNNDNNVANVQPSTNENDVNPSNDSEDEPIEEVEENLDQKVTLFLSGDGLIHESVYMDAMNEDGTFNFDKQLYRIKEISSKYDLASYNQETILGGTQLGLSGYPTFNSPIEYGEYMVSAGFNLVSTANNHCLDKGEIGIQNSRAFWNSQSNVLMDGTATSQEEQDQIPSMEVNGIKVAYLSYCEHTNGIYAPYSYSVNYYPGNEEAMLAKVRQAKAENDLVIVAMHWGDEYSHDVNQTQYYLADQLTQAGADVIVGNHVHVIQPFQWVNGKPVFYAMGNLISSQLNVENLTGMIAGMDIIKHTNEDGSTEIKIENVRADLIYTYMEGVYPALRTNIQVYPYNQLTDDILYNHESYYEQFKQVITALDSNITIGGVENVISE